MAAQPDDVNIGADGIVEAMIQAQALAADDEAADDELDEIGGDDEDLDDEDDLMGEWIDDDEEIAAVLPDEMTFGPDDDIPPYASDSSSPSS